MVPALNPAIEAPRAPSHAVRRNDRRLTCGFLAGGRGLAGRTPAMAAIRLVPFRPSVRCLAPPPPPGRRHPPDGPPRPSGCGAWPQGRPPTSLLPDVGADEVALAGVSLGHRGRVILTGCP